MSISEKQKENALKEYGKLPLFFIPNCGQLSSVIQYYAHSNPRIHFATDEIKIMFWENRLRNDRCGRRIRDILAKEETDRYVRGMLLALHFIKPNPRVTLTGQKEGPGRANYFTGNNSSKWVTDLPVYQEVVYKDLWDGIIH